MVSRTAWYPHAWHVAEVWHPAEVWLPTALWDTVSSWDAVPYQCVLATGNGASVRYEALEAECVPIVERTHAELYHEALFTDNFPSAPAPSKRKAPTPRALARAVLQAHAIGDERGVVSLLAVSHSGFGPSVLSLRGTAGLVGRGWAWSA